MSGIPCPVFPVITCREGSRAPRSHVSGRDFLAVARGQRPEPRRPYTFDALGLTAPEYDELISKSFDYVRTAPLAGLTPLDWSTL